MKPSAGQVPANLANPGKRGSEVSSLWIERFPDCFWSQVVSKYVVDGPTRGTSRVLLVSNGSCSNPMMSGNGLLRSKAKPFSGLPLVATKQISKYAVETSVKIKESETSQKEGPGGMRRRTEKREGIAVIQSKQEQSMKWNDAVPSVLFNTSRMSQSVSSCLGGVMVRVPGQPWKRSFNEEAPS